MKHKVILFMPSIEGGGVEKNLFIVSNYLSKKVKNLLLITISKNKKKNFNKSVKIICPNSDYFDTLSRRFKYFIALLILVREIFKDRNIIVFAFQANIYCIIICKLFLVKVITRSNSAPIGWSKNFIKRLIFKYCLRLADKVMVNSIEFKYEIKKEFGVKAVCIYNPLNYYEIIKKSKIRKHKIFSNKKNLKIINVGRFTDQKDQITLLKAINLIKNKIKIELVIIGRGLLKYKLLNFIKKNNLKKFVKIINFTENPFPYIKQSEVFILSSKFEGLPNVLLESIALNKFVISSSCKTGPKEILINGKGGLLFKVGDYNQLSKKIIYYSKNKKKCLLMLKKSIKGLSRFDYNKNLNKYLHFIESIK